MLPATLDETYERMLTGIDEIFRDEALTLLRWLAYAQTPPTLMELAEASIIDPSGEGSVDMDNRGNLKDTLQGTLEILSGLVSCGGGNGECGNDEDDSVANNDSASSLEETGEEVLESEKSHYDNGHITWTGRRISVSSKVRLAHFSVKECLESKRITQSSARQFSLDSAECHRFLAHSCLTYIMHYSSSDLKWSSIQDLCRFPLLRYAARSWYYHSLLKSSNDMSRETAVLQAENIKRDWLLVHSPDMELRKPFDDCLNDIGQSLYYASLLGLLPVVDMLVKQGADVNTRGGHLGNALQAASERGHEEIVRLLIVHGADINAVGGQWGSALQAATRRGHEKVVNTLIKHAVDVETPQYPFISVLQAAIFEGHEKVLEALIKQGADINIRGSFFDEKLEDFI